MPTIDPTNQLLAQASSDASSMQLTMFDSLISLALATAFGVVVAILQLLAHRDKPTYRLWRTLVLIAPLIAMATMAVGTNLAAAFTLFGTLAIVRFRTAIKNPLDAAFVIFSVVIGLSTGNQNYTVALIGTIVIATTVIILLAFNRIGPSEYRADLRVAFNSSDPPRAEWEAIFSRHKIGYKIESCTVDMDKQSQTISFELSNVDEQKWPELLNEVVSLQSVSRATGRANKI